MRLLNKPVYAGYVSAPEWGVSLREGQHEGLISFETFERIQQRLRESARTPARKDIRKDFPLRGAVACQCGKALTAGWSKGQYRKHPYYFCRNRECEVYGKSIPCDRLETEFCELLSQVQGAPRLTEIAAAMFRDYWNRKLEQARSLADTLRHEAQAAEQTTEDLVERIVAATNPRVVAAYEKRIDALEREKLVLNEKLQNAADPPGGFDELFELSVRFLASLCKFWDSGRFELQRTVLKLAFADLLDYERESIV